MSDLKTMSRRSFLNAGWKFCLSLFGLGILSGSYSVYGERFWYQVNKIPLRVKNLPEGFKGWKIVQISDVHLGFHYGIDEFKEVVKIINGLGPDILFFTGDLVQAGFQEAEVVVPLLSELKAPRGGKWAVSGNHDYLTKDKVVKAFLDSNFNYLENNYGYISLNQQRLYIAGLDDIMYGRPSLDEAFLGLSEEDCVLLLVHEPDTADLSCKYPASAQFSGHSHGGQVRIPFYGPIIRQELAEKYFDGLYYVGEKRMPLYVNRGIGTTELPVRLACRPEITLFLLST